MDISVEWGCMDEAEKTCDGSIEIFNGELAGLGPLKATSSFKISSRDSWKSKVGKGKTDGIKITVWYARNDDVYSFDKTIVTVRSKAHSFSFLVDDLEKGEQIFIKDYDVLVSRTVDNADLRTRGRELAEQKGTTLFDLIDMMPEQTLERAWRELPAEARDIHFIVGCKGRRQKFGVNARGMVFFPKCWNVRVKGKYSERFLWDGDAITYIFGFPDTEPEGRNLEGGFLPIIYAKWVEDGIIYEQEAFATLLFKDVLDDLKGEEKIDGDDPVVCMTKTTVTSQSPTCKRVNLKLASIDKSQWKDVYGVSEPLEYRDGFVFATDTKKPAEKRLRYLFDTNGKGEVLGGFSPLHFTWPERYLLYEMTLRPGESHTFYVKIPSITLLDKPEFEKLKGLEFEAERAKIVKYWLSLLSRGTQIEVPNEWLRDFYRAYLSHVHITDDKEPDSQRYICRVSSFNYGFFTNEATMVINELDRRGLRDEAERRLDVFTHYQGTAVMAGMYATKDGVFYGAGGYECGRGYGQHHGWSLWVLAEHYRYTRDKEWLSKVAPNLIKGCDWIIKERQATMKFDEKGKKVIEYGFLPPGGVEDVTDFWHWNATNAHAYRGLKSVADVLGEINHLEARRLKKEAEAYRKDLLAGMMEAAVRSPVVKLRDGTWIPHFPSRPERRGRDSGWIRETLEGAMLLIITGLVDPYSKEAEWILKDFEDNLYISEQYGYTIPDFNRYWFSRGGFSMQPNLYGFQIPYIMRDDTKHYIRAVFNSFTIAFYPNTRMLTEHPLPTMADWAGDHFKTSDEAISCGCLRLMLIYEKGKDLLLLPAVPHAWLEDGKRIAVKDAATYFGNLSFKVESKVSEGLIKMTLTPPMRNPPKSINVRFRHPKDLKISKVQVNGKEWKDFEGDMVHIKRIKKTVDIAVYYRHSQLSQ